MRINETSHCIKQKEYCELANFWVRIKEFVAFNHQKVVYI